MVRVGVIGAGFMGKTHAAAYARIPGVEVAAVVDAELERAKQLAAEVGGAAFSDDSAADLRSRCRRDRRLLANAAASGDSHPQSASRQARSDGEAPGAQPAGGGCYARSCTLLG